MDPAWKRLATVLGGIGLSAGLAGCYVPGGGWTLRTGIDVRTIRKPAAFVEMVDTKWDEWNRVSQINLCEGNNHAVPMVIEPIASVPPQTQNDPTLIPLPEQPRLDPATEHPVLPRGRDSVPVPAEPKDSAGPPPAEDIPAPPAPGNPSAGDLRPRARRRREVFDSPNSLNRPALVPASARSRPRARFAEMEEGVYDRGAVTLDTPQPNSASEEEIEYAASQNEAQWRNSSSTGPVIRPGTQSQQPASLTNRAIRDATSHGAWMFSKP